MQDSWLDFFNGSCFFSNIHYLFVFWWINKKSVTKMQSFSRGIFFFFRPTKLVQPRKSYSQSKIEKGEICDCAKSLDYYHSKSASRGPKNHLHGKWRLKLGQDKPTLKIDCLAIEWYRFFSWWIKWIWRLKDFFFGR